MRVFMIICCLLMTLASGYFLVKRGFEWEGIVGLLFGGLGALMFIFQKQWDAWTSRKMKLRITKTNCQIEKDHFYFPKGYYFRYGFLKDRDRLPFDRISEVRINTRPPSAIVDNQEVIFLRGLTEKQLLNLENANKITCVKPQDNWSLICEVFLDTEVTEEEDDRMLVMLENSGIPREEVKRIRKRLRFRMLMRTMLSWEWLYYGQYHVLEELRPLSSKKYKWTMDIALRKKDDHSETI